MVAELQIPDVGLFLCGLNPYGNEVFSQIQKVVIDKDSVYDRNLLAANLI